MLPHLAAYVCGGNVQVGRYGEDDFDFSAARVKASVTESLERLQVS